MSLETEGQDGELLPQVPVGLNESGKVEIDEDGIYVKGTNYDDVHVHHRRKRDTWSPLLLEPGRYSTLYIWPSLCNISRKYCPNL